MRDLAEFLLSCADTLEREARKATPGPWRYNPGKEWHRDPKNLERARAGWLTFDGEEFVGAGPLDDTVGVAATGTRDHPQSMADAAFIAPPRPCQRPC